MFLNGKPSLITIPYIINFVTFKHVSTCMAKQLSKYFKSVMKIYSKIIIVVHTVLMGMYFVNTIDDIMDNFVVNTPSAKEHISNIEITVRTVKKKYLVYLQQYAFQVPSQISHHQYHVLFIPMAECLPGKKYNIRKLSPRAIMVRTDSDWKSTENW